MGKKPVTVYLTPEERAAFERHAEAMGMSLSAYMRLRLNPSGGWTWSSAQGGNHISGVTFTWMPPGNESVQGRDVK